MSDTVLSREEIKKRRINVQSFFEDLPDDPVLSKLKSYLIKYLDNHDTLIDDTEAQSK